MPKNKINKKKMEFYNYFYNTIQSIHQYFKLFSYIITDKVSFLKHLIAVCFAFALFI